MDEGVGDWDTRMGMLLMLGFTRHGILPHLAVRSVPTFPPPDPAVVTESWPGTADCHESPLSAVRLDHQIVLNQWLTFAMPDPHPFRLFRTHPLLKLSTGGTIA